MGVVHLDFRKAFDTVSHKILIDKLLNCGLKRQAAMWIENWLNGRSQRMVISDAESSWRPATSKSTPGVNTVSSSLQCLHWMMRQSVCSASLLKTQNWEEWQIQQRVELPSKGSSTGWGNGLTRTSRSAKPCTCGGTTPGTRTLRGHTAGKQLCRKGPGGVTKLNMSHQ